MGAAQDSRRGAAVIKLKAIVPKSLAFDPKGMARAIKNGLDGAARGAKVDFDVTAQTWKHKPAFRIEAPNAMARTVSTDDEIYGYLDQGTRAHRIVARRAKRLRFMSGFRPKTRAGYIGSNQGSRSGAPVFAQAVNHPGTKPRKLAKAIATKWQKQASVILQRAIDAEVSG